MTLLSAIAIPFKKIALTAALGLLIGSMIKTTDAPADLYPVTVRIGSATLQVQTAVTQQAMSQGLSGKMQMPENSGMLFVFPSSQQVGFWMKDMRFGLDFIWIDKGRVVGITPNVPAPQPGTADSLLPTYYPPLPVDEVIEVHSGWTQKNKITAGSGVSVFENK